MQVQEKCCDCKFKEENVSPVKEFPSSLQKSVDDIIKKEGYESYKVFNRMISTGGGNYLGVLYEVDVKGNTADGEKGTNLFVKNIIPSENITTLSVTEAYLTESYAYNELFKIYSDLQNEAKIPIEERYKTVKSFHSDSDAIFLENMTKKGFKTLNRMDVMPLKFAELSVQQLAKFHALSFVLQKRNPDYFDRKLKPMKTSMIFNDDWRKWLLNMVEKAMVFLDETQKEKVAKFMPTMAEKYQSYFEEVTWGCVCHQDYRQNNILMKEVNGEIAEVLPIDYQLLYYGCPLNDFVYLITTGTDKEFRNNHLIDLKTMYYDTLEQFLRHFDMDVSVIFPRKEFERYYEERLEYGLVLSLFMVPFMFITEDTVPEIGSDDMTNLNLNFEIGLKERLRGLIDDFVRWGYL